MMNADNCSEVIQRKVVTDMKGHFLAEERFFIKSWLAVILQKNKKFLKKITSRFLTGLGILPA